MKKNDIKKGFTLVELLVVIAIIAVLATVSVIGYMGFTKKAALSNDIGLVNQLNTTLLANEATEGKNKTMYDAALDLDEVGYDVEKMTPTSQGFDILWDQKNDRFVLKDGETVKYCDEATTVSEGHLLWKVVDEYDGGLKESQYLRDKEFSNPTIISNVKTGLDLGKNKEKFTVEYNGTIDTDRVRIRTNGSQSNLSVNTLTSSVEHYGSLGNAEILNVPMDCYYENGSTAYVTLTKGKLVVENQSKVDVLNVKASAAGDIALTVSSQAKVTNTYCENETIKTAVGAIVKEATKQEIVVKTEAEIKKVVTEAKNSALAEENNADLAITKDGTNDTEYITLHQLRDNVNGGTNTYAGCTITLLRDIDLKNELWTPIGTGYPGNNCPFMGKFDGNNKTIRNFRTSTAHKSGLFGKVNGTPLEDFDFTYGDDGTNWKLWDGEALNTDLVSEDKYTACIKNLIVENANCEINYEKGITCAAIVATAEDAYIANNVVKNSVITGAKVTGAIAGYAVRCTFVNNMTTDDVTVNTIYEHIGGIVGKVSGGVLIGNVNNAKVIGAVYTAGICGWNCVANNGSQNMTILYKNTNNGEITSLDNKAIFVGGIFGGNATGHTLHIESVNNGNISITVNGETTNAVGGINAASSHTELINSVNNGNVSGNSDNVGLLIGYSGENNYTLTNSTSSAKATNNSGETNRLVGNLDNAN